MPYLSLKNINKVYPGAVQAVFDFNLDAENGDFIVLVGPSGCGKSTVLRMIAGLEEISSGDMILNEKRINDLAPCDREVAMVFQDYALYGNMTVYQNIGFSLTIKGKTNEDIHDRVMDVSKTVELSDYLNRFPKALSGGQRQRVAMGRSLAKHAKVLLMDEPLSNLDAKLRQQTRRELSILHNKLKPTIVYVTHDQIEAMTLASRIVVMNEGRIQQIGSPYEIYHTPANVFTASFIGSPPINFIRGILNNDTGKKVILGLRPEIIGILKQGEKEDINTCVFDAVVESYEFLGSEYNVVLKMQGQMLIRQKHFIECSDDKTDLKKNTLTCRIPANTEISAGQKLKICFKIDKAHFFDEASGLRLQRI